MSEDLTSFHDLVRRVRAGDEAAATELVQRYEPEIRREVRLRLRGPMLRRVLDSMDIAQTVLRRFFLRAAIGDFELEHPRQLLGLLTTMAKNEVTDWARRLRREKRDKRRERDLDALQAAGKMPAAPGPSPSAMVSAAELLEEVRSRMSDTEGKIASLRAMGRTWEQIGAELGVGPHAVRKRLMRAWQRISNELGLDNPPAV